MESPRSRTLGSWGFGWGGLTSHVHSISSEMDSGTWASNGKAAVAKRNSEIDFPRTFPRNGPVTKTNRQSCNLDLNDSCLNRHISFYPHSNSANRDSSSEN